MNCTEAIAKLDQLHAEAKENGIADGATWCMMKTGRWTDDMT